MERKSSSGFWLVLTTVVIVSLGFLAEDVASQRRGRTNCSVSTPPNTKQPGSTCFGKATFARCSCIYTELEMSLCAAWKLSNKTSIRVFNHFMREQTSRPKAAPVTGSCTGYTNIINNLYGSDNSGLNYLKDQEAKFYGIDMSFCEDMSQNNHHGCNYTLVPVTNFHNNSAEMIFFYVGSFSNVSHHMIIGKHYQMSAEKCQGLGNASEEQQMAITMTSTQKTCNGNPPRSSGIILFASPILEQMVFFFCVIIYLDSFP